MSDMQEKDKEASKTEEEDGSMETQAYPHLEGEVGKTGWGVELVHQNEKDVIFRVYCRDVERDWFKLIVKCPKSRFKRIGG